MRALKPQNLVGETVAGYRLEKYLGMGATAWVYKAVSEVNPEIVRALKIVKPELVAEPEVRRRFAREARAFEVINHPAVVSFFGLQETDDFLIMEIEYLEGQTLEEVRPKGTLPIQDVCEWIRDAAEGVGSAHAQGIVHRDLKPSNVFLTKDGQVKVLDFGLARLQETTSTFHGSRTALGTAQYMAPEVVKEGGRRAVPASDVYSLALTMYALLIGRSPFGPESAEPGGDDQAYMWAHVHQDAPPLRELRPDAPQWLEEQLMRALDKDPDRRHRNCSEFAAALAAAGGTSSAIPIFNGVAPPPQLGPSVFASPAVMLGLVVAALVVGGGGMYAFMLSQQGDSPTPQASTRRAPPAPTVPTPMVPPPPATAIVVAECSDDGATGAALTAANAWHSCRWSKAVALYRAPDDSFTPAARGCARDRIRAYEAASTEKLQQIEDVLGSSSAQSCHIARPKLKKLGSFTPSSQCREWVSNCEDGQWRALRAEVRDSERKLNGEISGSAFVSSVSFQRVRRNWQWDIVLRGKWRRYFQELREMLIGDDTQLQVTMLSYFIAVVDAVGKESQSTNWRSRRLKLVDGGMCMYMSTKQARTVSRTLKRLQDDASAVRRLVELVVNQKTCA